MPNGIGVGGADLGTDPLSTGGGGGTGLTSANISVSSGFAYASTLEVNVVPPSNTTAVVFGDRARAIYNSTFNTSAPGYLSASSSEIVTSGSGTHDKLVGHLVQLSTANGAGNITSAVGNESSFNALGATTLVGSYASYYCPNLAAVPNIGNINLFYAFANDHIGAPGQALAKPSIVKNSGITVNGTLRELAPAPHAGLVAGRFYSAPTTALSSAAVLANTAYFVPVYIPHRCNPINLSINITTGAAGNVVMGLYNSACSGFPSAVNGVPTTLVAQTAQLSTASTGLVSGSITIPAGYIDAGLYFIAVLFSATPSVTQHTVDASRVALHGAGSIADLTALGYVPTAYSSTLPATVGVLTYTNAITTEPRACFRV